MVILHDIQIAIRG